MQICWLWGLQILAPSRILVNVIIIMLTSKALVQKIEIVYDLVLALAKALIL